MLRKLFPLTLCLTAAITLSACYRVPIPQGNVLTPQMVDRINFGMSSYQVQSILGSPVLNNLYDNNQMAYVYTYKKGMGRMTKKRVIIYFKNNKVDHVVSDYKAADAPLPEPN